MSSYHQRNYRVREKARKYIYTHNNRTSFLELTGGLHGVYINRTSIISYFRYRGGKVLYTRCSFPYKKANVIIKILDYRSNR